MRRGRFTRSFWTVRIVAAAWLTVSTIGPARAQEANAPSPTLQQISDGLNALARQVNPSVVQVFSTGYVASLNRTAPGEGLLSRQRSTGSGVLLDEKGYIVTNAHVVEGASRIEVLFASDPSRSSSPNQSVLKQRGDLVGAQLVGIDHETDLAVIKIEGEGFPTLPLADSEAIRQGEIVFAFGSPLGLENSVSMGVVSSTARQLEPDAPMIYIQTDAVINPGNSGGPLVDTQGRVIGINTFIFSQSGGSEGLGFAVPSNIVRNVYGQIRNTGRVRRGLIGTNVQTITYDLADALGLPRDWGVVVADVIPNSPAAQGDLRIGDVITHLNGKVMENARQFDVNLYALRAQDQVEIRVERQGGATRTLTVTVAERRDDPRQLAELVNPDHNLIDNLGIFAIELDPVILQYLPPLRRQTGVVVASGSSENPYWQVRFRPGDVIYAVNGVAIANLLDLRAEAAKLSKGDPVAVQIERAGRLMFISFQVR